MTSSSYANALRQFEEQIEQLDSELVRLSFGPALMDYVAGTTPECPVPLSADEPLTEPSTENSDGNGCRLCLDLGSKAEKFDSLQLKRKHARIHFYQQRCVEPTVDFRDLLKRCFTDMGNNSADKSEGTNPNTPMADLLSNYGRGKRRQSNADQMACTSGAVENKRRKLDQSAPCQPIKKQEACAEDLTDGKQLRQLVYELICGNLNNNTNTIKCRLCLFEVNLQSPAEDGNEDDVTVLVKFNTALECMRLLEHAFDHIGRILEYPCPRCDYTTGQYLAIQDHTSRMHGITSFKCNVGKLPCDDDSLSALRRCFAESGEDNATNNGIKDGPTLANPDVAKTDNSKPQLVLNEEAVPKEKQPPMPEKQQAGGESNRKAHWRKSFFGGFFRQYCDGLDERIVPANGQVLCRLCAKNIKVGSPHRDRIIWTNLFCHALRHLWPQLHNRRYPENYCWPGMNKHPRETGEMMIACYGAVEEPEEGGD